MALSRYSVTDEYVLEELRREYQMADAKGRIRLLKRLYKSGITPPFEVMLSAVEDPNVEVRQWIARNGKSLDRRGFRLVNDELVPEPPERNLIERLKNDPDPFVRACLLENPHASDGDEAWWMERFREATHLERLALVRNPEVHRALSFRGSLLEMIFDPEDKELGINLEERTELARAFLTNEKALAQIAVPLMDPSAEALAHRFSRTIWNLALNWPADGIGAPRDKIPWLVYEHVPARDEIKAEIYQKIDEPVLRRVILESCTRLAEKTLKLGIKDDDDTCRFLACEKVPSIEPELLRAILKGEDKAALEGLACNGLLFLDVGDPREFEPPDWLCELGYRKWTTVKEGTYALVEKARDRLRELDPDNDWLYEAHKTIVQLEEQIPLEQEQRYPEEFFERWDVWFGAENRGKFRVDKINFIGKKVKSLDEDLQKLRNQLRKSQNWFAVIAFVGLAAIEMILLRSFFSS